MALLKENHPNRDFFVVDFADVTSKDDTATMEHPLFSLATKPDMRHLRYENGNVSLEIEPGQHGLPTIFDKDVLIFCISLLMSRKNAGKSINPRIRFSARELSIATNRPIGGNHYKRLEQAFKRLVGMTFTTNIPFGNGKRQTRLFHLVDEASFVSSGDEGARLEFCEVKLSDWTMEAIASNAIVSINRDYFRLRRPLERRLYELARKHCGNQPKWTIGLEKLQLKTGSNAPLKRFRFNLRQTIEDDHLPVYEIELGANDLVTFRPRKVAKQLTADISIPEWATEKGREIAHEKGWDFYALEREFVGFATGKIATGDAPQDIGAAFVGFCKKKKALR